MPEKKDYNFIKGLTLGSLPSLLVGGSMGLAVGAMSGSALTLNHIDNAIELSAAKAGQQLVDQEMIEVQEQVQNELMTPVLSDFNQLQTNVDQLREDLDVIDSAWKPVKDDVDAMSTAYLDFKASSDVLAKISAAGEFAKALSGMQEDTPVLWTFTQETLPKIGVDLATIDSSFQSLQGKIDAAKTSMEEGEAPKTFDEDDKEKFTQDLKLEIAKNSGLYSLIVSPTEDTDSVFEEDPFK